MQNLAKLAAGPIIAGLGGAAVGRAAGGIIGALAGMGIPEYEAKLYDGKIRGGNALISVHTDSADQAKNAKEISKRFGVEDIRSTSEASVPSHGGRFIPAAAVAGDPLLRAQTHGLPGFPRASYARVRGRRGSRSSRKPKAATQQRPRW